MSVSREEPRCSDERLARRASCSDERLARELSIAEVRDIVVHYGRIEALHGVSLVVREGELVTLLGSNGAGKTTTMRAISGLLPLSRGSVWFEGRDISGTKAHKRVADGLIQAPEGRGVFPGMTVTENLEMGCYGRKFPSRAEHREKLDWVFETFPGWPKDATRSAARCRGVNSRCSRSGGP